VSRPRGVLFQGRDIRRSRRVVEVTELSPSEVKGLIEQRRFLAALTKRGDERCDILWHWDGKKLKRIVIKDYAVLIELD